MFASNRYSGHILLIVLTVVFLLGLFLQYMAQVLVLEYQRVGNNVLEYKLLQELQAISAELLQDLAVKEKTEAEKSAAEVFIPDTFDLNGQSGIKIFKFSAAAKTLPAQFSIGYSVRQ